MLFWFGSPLSKIQRTSIIATNSIARSAPDRESGKMKPLGLKNCYCQFVRSSNYFSVSLLLRVSLYVCLDLYVSFSLPFTTHTKRTRTCSLCLSVSLNTHIFHCMCVSLCLFLPFTTHKTNAHMLSLSSPCAQSLSVCLSLLPPSLSISLSVSLRVCLRFSTSVLSLQPQCNCACVQKLSSSMTR